MLTTARPRFHLRDPIPRDRARVTRLHDDAGSTKQVRVTGIAPAINRLKVEITSIGIGRGEAARHEVGEAHIKSSKGQPEAAGYGLARYISGLDTETQACTHKR